MKKALICTIFLTAVILLGALPAAAAPSYTCKALPPLPGYPSNINQPTCINNTGQVSGYNQGAQHAFCYTDRTGVIQDLGTLPDPYNLDSYGYGINDAGQVVGKSDSSTYGYYHPFLYTPGNSPPMQDLVGLPGFTDAGSANGINNAGQVVGTSKTLLSGYTRAFLYTPGDPPTMQDLGGLNQVYILSSASRINAAGQVVGRSFFGFGPEMGIFHAFLWSSGGGMQDLGTLQSPYDAGSSATAINAGGQVVGISNQYSPYVSHAFLYTPGSPPVMLDLGTLPAPYDNASVACGINAAGQVVGYCWTSSYAYHAWLYSGGVMTDLNSLVRNLPVGEVLNYAYGINDRGQIAVNGSNGAYLLTPVSPLAGLDMLLLN